MGQPALIAAWREILTAPGMGSPVPDTIQQEHKQKGKNIIKPKDFGQECLCMVRENDQKNPCRFQARIIFC